MDKSFSPRGYKLRGRYQNAVRTGAVTAVAAHTATLGHLLSWRWDDTTVTGVIGLVRYVGARFCLSTAFGTDQEMGIKLTRATSFTASHTGGTAVDVGGTVTGTGKRRYAQPASLLTSMRVADTDGLTAGTHTFDANPLSIYTGFAETIGDTLPRHTSGGGLVSLWDSRESGDHLEFDNDEGFVISNLLLMGATGVGTWTFVVEWDEGVLDGRS
jgi:hypothetical protein